MKPRRIFSAARLSFQLATALVALFTASSVHAASGTWTGAAGTGIWGGVGNWTGSVVADGTGFTANFTSEYTATQNVTVNALNRTIGNITFTDTTSSHDVNIIAAAPTPFDLILDVTTGSPAINVTQSDRILTISNRVAGADGLTKSGTGMLVLTNANTFTGAAVVTAGTLRATGTAGSLGAGTLTMNGGTLQLANDTALGYGRNTTVSATSTITSDRLSAGAGVTHTLGTLSAGAFTLNVNRGANATSGTGGITFGATTLTGAANFAPAANSLLTVPAVTMAANVLTKSAAGSMTATGVVTGSTAAGTTAVNISAGLLTLSGANTFTGNIAASSATSVFAMAGNTFTTTAPYGAAGNLYKQILLTNGGTFRLNSGSFNNNAPTATNVAAGIIFNIGTGGGILDIASGATLIIDDGTGTGTATTNSQLQGAGNLTKTGLGTFQFDDSTAYAGTITVTAGLLQPASGNAFGSSAASTTIQSGAALNVNGVTMTNAEPVNLAGTGLAAAPVGALTSTTGSGTWVGPITIASGGATIGGGAGVLTVTSTINIGANTLTLRHAAGNQLTNGIISGSGNVIVGGSSTGVVGMSAASTYTGGTSLDSGNVAVGFSSTGSAGSPTDGPFGAGSAPVVFNGSQVRCGTGGPFTFGNAVTIATDTTFNTVGSEKTLTLTGPVTLTGATRTLTSNVGSTVPGTTVVFNGAIDDGASSFGLIKAGTGNLTLGGANTYEGGTTVNSGALYLTGSLQTGTDLVINPTVAGGATFSLAGGAANSVANVSALTLGSVTGPTTLALELGAATASSDSINTPNAATTAGTVNIGIMDLPGFGSASTYDLITAPSGLSGATYSLTNAPGGFTYTLTSSDTLVQLGMTPTTAGDIYWRGNISGSNSWSALSALNTNWYTTAAGTVNAQANPGAGDTVNFSTVNATNTVGVITTTLDNNFTVNDLVFGNNPNGVTSVTIAGGLTPAGAPGVLAIAPSASTDGVNVGSNAGSVTISSPVILGAAQTWTVDGTGANGSTLTVSGPVTGSGTLDISGLVTLSSPAGTSTYNGATTVPNGGILQSGATNSFSASSAVTVNGTGIVRLNGFSNTVTTLTGAGTVQNNHASTAATLTLGDATDFTFSGTLQNGGVGTLGLTKTGAGKLTLSGVNTHTGLATVNAGTLIIGAATALPGTNSMTLSGTGTLDLNGFNQTVAAFASTATNFITNNAAGTGTNTLNITTASPTLGALITDGATAKTAIRANNNNGGDQFLTNSGNTFSGGLTLAHNVSGGTRINIGVITGTPWGTGPITVGEANTDRAGIYFGNAGQTLTNAVIANTNLGSDRVGTFRVDVTGTVLSGQLTANLAPVTFGTNSNGGVTVTGKITGVNGLTLLASSLGGTSLIVALNNVANDYSGNTVINENAQVGKTFTLALGANDQIPNGAGKGNVSITTNGTGAGLLSLAGFSDTINGLSGNGLVDSVSGSATLTLGDNNATASFSGVLRNTTSTLNITKIGTGTQTFSGASTFTGALTVNEGLVAFATSPATAGPLGNTTAVNLSGGGISYTAAGANTLNRTVAIGALDGTVDVASSTGVLSIATVTSTAGNLIKTGSGAAVISGSTTLNGGAAGVAVNSGTLQAGFGTAGVATISVGATGNLDQSNTVVEALTLGNAAGALTLAGGAQVGFEISGATNDSIAVGASGTAVTAGVVTLNFFGTPTAGTYNLLSSPSGLSGATYALGVAPNGFNYTINVTDSLVSLTVTAYTPIYWRGGQDVSWNTLGSTPANWTTDGGGITDATSTPISSDTVLFSATSAPFTSGTVIDTTLDAAFTVNSLQFTNGPAGVTAVSIAAGSGGTLTLTPASASGGIRVLTGGGNATISAPLTLGASQTWDVDPTGSLTISGDTVFNGNVLKSNTGALTLSGTNSGSGAITLGGGTLNINSSTALGSGAFTIGAGTSINASAGAIALTNNNVQNWIGDFTFTGANDLNLGTGAVTLGSSLTLTASANILTVGGNIGDGGNNRGFTKAGAGTMILNGANTYTGAVSITGGILRITNSTGLGTAAGGVTQTGASTLELDGTGGAITVGAEALTINGGGVTVPTPNLGALRNIAGDNTYGGTVTMGSQSRINSDSGTLTLSHLTSVSATNLTLVVGGAGNLTISGAVAIGTGGIGKDGAGILTLGGNSTYTGNTTINSGILNITGSITGNTTSSSLDYGTTAGNTVVNLSGNLTARVTTGANVAGAVSVFNQTAGTVTIVPPNAQDLQYLANNGGYGMLNITGGTFNTGRFDGAGVTNNNASTAVIYVGGGGALTQNVGDWFLPIRNSGNMSMTVAPGGSFTRSAAVTAQFSITGLSMSSTNNLSYGILNVAGGDVDTGTKGINFSQGTFASGTFTSTGFVNVAGGTLSLGLNTATGTGAVGTTNAYFNFAGGTVKATAAMTAVIPASTANYIFASTVFGPVTNNDNANAAFNTQIGSTSNFTGGLTVDTNGFATTFTNAFLAASGFGVTQADIGDVSLLGGNSGYVGAPMVTFSAPTSAGVPASGYAVIDPVSGSVTGIVITNPGVYDASETPTITLTGGGGAIAPFATTALATANTSGGLTKINPGTLTLSGANTYTGATLVSGGTLQLNGAAATTPTTSAVTVSAGGTLGFTTGTASALDLSTKDMTLSGGTLAFDISDATVNDSITVNNFTLTANSAFSFTSIGAISGTYTLVTSVNPITNAGSHTISGQTIGRVTLTPTINTNTITIGSSVFEGKWNVAGGGNWSLGNPTMTQDNWLNYKPTVAGDATLFGDSIVAPSTVAVDTPHIMGYLRFDNANAYTIGANGSSNLILNNGTSNAVITVTSGSHTIAENVALLSSLDVIPAAATQLTMSGVLSGAASKAVEFNGPGEVVLSGVNTYAGTTTVSNGTLSLTGSLTGGGAFTVSGSGIISQSSSGIISGASTLTHTSSGSSTLEGVNPYTGTTAVSNGTLNLTGSLTGGGAITVSGSGILSQSSSGIISGASSITHTSSGSSILEGVNTYTGTTTVSNGELTLSGARTATMGAINVGNVNGSTGALNISNGVFSTGTVSLGVGNGTAIGVVNQSEGTVTLTGGTQLIIGNGGTGGALAGNGGNGTYNLSGGTLTATAVANRGVMLGTNDGGTSTFNLSGTGTLTLTGASVLMVGRSDSPVVNTTNLFNQTGGTAAVTNLTIGGAAAGATGLNSTFTATGGTFSATTFNNLGAGASGTVAMNIGGSAQVTLPAFPTTRGALTTATIIFDSGATGFLSPSAASATYMPANTFNNAYLTDNGANFNIPTTKDITVAQVLADAPTFAGTLTKSGIGNLTLTGANTYTGATSVSAGTIISGNVDALGTAAAGTTVASGARVTFFAMATNLTVAEPFEIAGTGTTGNGVLNMGGNKNVSLAGAVTLTGNSLVTADGGSSLNFTGASGITGTDTNFSFTTDGAVASSITGPVTLGTGSFTKNGGSTLILSGNNSYSGGTALAAGVIQADHNNALGSGAVVITGTRLSIGSGITIANPITINANGGTSGRGLIEASAGTAILSGPITINNATPAGGLFASAGAAVLDIQGVITSSVQVSQRIGAVKYTGGGTGYTAMIATGTTIVGATNGIATTATVTLGGSANSTLDLNGFNQSLAGIVRNANTTTIGNSSLTTDSVLTTTGTSSYSGTIVDSVLSGTRKVGLTVDSGDLTLTGANTYTGGTTLNQGILTVGTGGTIGGTTGTLSVNNTNTAAGNDAILNLATAVNTTVGSLSGTIATPSGGTNTATINTQTGRTFTVNQTVDASFAGAIAGPGNFILGSLSTNTLTLTGANTYTGNTTVDAGTLALADNAQLTFVIGATSNVNNGVTGTGTLTIDGDFNIDTTLTDASPLTTGTWTLVDASTLAETFNSSFTILGAGWTQNANVWTKTVGSKKYTFTEADGKLVLSPSASYASWIDSFFPGETNPAIIGAGADPDNDGISNGAEMVLGGNPATGMDTALLPTIELVNADPDGDTTFSDYLLFTYRRSDLSVTAGVTVDCETDTDLVAPWTAATGAPGVVILTDDNYNASFTPPAAADTDRVRVYVPQGANTTLFGRLNVLVP